MQYIVVLYFLRYTYLVFMSLLKGGMCVSDTRCLNVCFITQYYFMFYVTDKIMLNVKWVE